MPVGDQILGLPESVGLDRVGIPRRVVGHHHEGRCVKAANQQAELLVNGETGRTAHDGQTPRDEPTGYSIEEGRGHRGILFCFEEAKEASAVVVLRQVGIVLDRRDAAHQSTTRVRSQKQLGGRVCVKGMVWVQQVGDVASQRGTPHRVVPIEAEWQVDERAPVTCGAHRRNVDQVSLPPRPVTTPS